MSTVWNQSKMLTYFTFFVHTKSLKSNVQFMLTARPPPTWLYHSLFAYLCCFRYFVIMNSDHVDILAHRLVCMFFRGRTPRSKNRIFLDSWCILQVAIQKAFPHLYSHQLTMTLIKKTKLCLLKLSWNFLNLPKFNLTFNGDFHLLFFDY